MSGRIWIQGAGELASGVAVRLFRCGYRIVMAEIPQPLAVRRLVCFSEAVYAGTTDIESVHSRLVDVSRATFERNEIGILVDPEGRRLSELAPDAVVDARMTKRPPVPLPDCQAPVIGLGPGFVCGQSATLVVETHREAQLGAVIARGTAAANTGIPGSIVGQTARRVVRAPCAGHLSPAVTIGDLVTEGQELGKVSRQPVKATLDGLVRGLVHPKAELTAGVKVGDIDPRGDAVDPNLISDKALAVAGGVLEALLRLGIRPAN